MFDLEADGTDTFVGSGLHYPWHSLYGGHIVAQALRAAASTVEVDKPPHSLRAYFIRRGDDREPVRYEVDRIRDGRSFTTRRVVARQAVGAILNLEASFQRAEPSMTVQTVIMPQGIPGPDDLPDVSWTSSFERRDVPDGTADDPARPGAGRLLRWFRHTGHPGELDDPAAALLHQCWLAYISDDVPAEAVLHIHPQYVPPPPVPPGEERPADEGGSNFGASLDHTVWFHRPMRIDEWHLHDVTCHGFVGGRGLAIGHVFAADGTHTATYAQEFLARF